MHIARFITVVLHEHVIPNLNEAIAIFIWTAWRTAGNMFTVIVKNLSARTARACIAHHPKIVGCITRTFVITNPNDAISRYANLIFPNRICLVIFGIDRH